MCPVSLTSPWTTKETILNELRKLNPKKACQESDIPVKIIKENLDIVSNFVYNNFNNFLFRYNFPPTFLKRTTDNVENYRPVRIFLFYRKYMKGVCTFKFMNTEIKLFQNRNAAFAKIIMRNTVFS